MRANLFPILVGCCSILGCRGAEGPPFKPTASVKDLMVSIVDPAADILWGSVGTVISKDGVDEWYPKSDEEWAALRKSAVTLMESGNLLMMGDRARDHETWMELSRSMIDAGAEALAAVDSKDPDAVFSVGERIYLTCERCHGLYRIDSNPAPLRAAPGSRPE